MDKNLIDYIYQNCIKRGNFILHGGEVVDYFIDLTSLFLSTYAFYIYEELIKLLDSLKYTSIGGPATGATPIISGFLGYFITKVNAFVINKNGTSCGKISKNVVLIDDVVTTGTSLKRCIDYVEGLGFNVVQIISIVDRSAPLVTTFGDIPYKSLLTSKDLEL